MIDRHAGDEPGITRTDRPPVNDFQDDGSDHERVDQSDVLVETGIEPFNGTPEEQSTSSPNVDALSHVEQGKAAQPESEGKGLGPAKHPTGTSGPEVSKAPHKKAAPKAKPSKTKKPKKAKKPKKSKVRDLVDQMLPGTGKYLPTWAAPIVDEVRKRSVPGVEPTAFMTKGNTLVVYTILDPSTPRPLDEEAEGRRAHGGLHRGPGADGRRRDAADRGGPEQAHQEGPGTGRGHGSRPRH